MQPAALSTTPTPAATARILVVDDGPVNVHLLSMMLTSLGYEAQPATSGEMALAAVADTMPDLILLDINMPGLDGYQVCQSLKAQPATAEIPVIFISALDEVTDKVKAFDMGGVDYITKPFQILEVQARVKTHLALRQLQQQLQHTNQLLAAERLKAGRIQADLLPEIAPLLPGFELVARCFPARDVGGDFYDWQSLAPDQLQFTLGDVMGKGMPAALLMATVRATFRALGEPHSPVSRIQQAQSLLTQDLGGSDSFVTLFHGQLNCSDRTLTYVDAGHGLGFIRRVNGTLEPLVKGGIPLGILEGQMYKTGTLTFAPGDALLLFSDGFVEHWPTVAKQPDLLLPHIAEARTAKELLHQMLDIVPSKIDLPDDLTVLVLYCGSATP